MPESPDTIVANKIIAELRVRKLLPEKRLAELESKLPTGDISAIAWEQMAELTIMEEDQTKNAKAD